jgi:DNA-binding GntR family transcriptional regulator
MVLGAGASASAAQKIETDLRRAIVALELQPGARLSEQDIANRYGVSRQPAREALLALSRTRLVDVQPQSGTTVSKISVVKMMQARFVREAIEVAIARRACQTFDPQFRVRIDDLLEMQQLSATAGDHDRFRHFDELFHVALAEGAGCPLAWQALADIKSHMDRVCQLTIPDVDAMMPLVAQHKAIVAAVDRRDPDAAAHAMQHHLTEIMRALPWVEAEHPDLFE